MITAEEARRKTATAKQVGKEVELQELKEALAEKEQIIIDSCKAGHSCAACVLPHSFHHLSMDEIREFTMAYFAQFGFTVKFNAKVSFRFIVSWG